MSVLHFSALDSATHDIALLSTGPKTREGNAQERAEWRASHQKEQEEELAAADYYLGCSICHFLLSESTAERLKTANGFEFTNTAEHGQPREQITYPVTRPYSALMPFKHKPL